MKTSENLSKIATALVAVQGDVKGISKNAQGHGYKYMTFDAILTLVKPVLTKHGVFLIQNVKGDMVEGQNVAYCETRLLHESGEWVESDTLLMKPVGKQTKGGGTAPVDPQAVGSALTYAKRYQLCGLLGINADVDDDASVASNKQNWGITITADQKHQISKVLVPQKGINKTVFNNLMIKEIGKIKELSKFTSDEASKMIVAMEEMPDKQVVDLQQAQ